MYMSFIPKGLFEIDKRHLQKLRFSKEALSDLMQSQISSQEVSPGIKLK